VEDTDTLPDILSIIPHQSYQELQENANANTVTVTSSVPTLFNLARQAVEELPKPLIEIVVATIVMPSRRKEFCAKSKISPLPHPLKPGCTIDIISNLELSASGEYLHCHFYDIIHSLTKLRSNLCKDGKPGILGGFIECWEFVAAEGKTPLTMSLLKDKPDMMSFAYARTFFCRDVEFRMKVKLKSLKLIF
jgi:hypothetical protein